VSQPTRQTTTGRVYLDLRARARREGRPTDELFVLYVLERFLYRLSVSSQKSRFVLKGGMLLAAFDERRPTGDVDLLAANISNDAETISRLIREILAIGVDDGVAFEPDGLRAAVIREADPYTGVRITVPASIARARHPLRIDVNVGDPVTPAPVEIAYPTLLGEPFEILGYPIETVLAEKIVNDGRPWRRDDLQSATSPMCSSSRSDTPSTPAPSAKPSRRLEHTAARISVRFDRSWSSWHRRASPTGSDSSTAAGSPTCCPATTPKRSLPWLRSPTRS
jgi:hypothetical protein